MLIINRPRYTLVKQANADMQKQFNIKIEIKARIR